MRLGKNMYKPERTKIAAVYEYKGKLIVASFDIVKEGPWIEKNANEIEDAEDSGLIGRYIYSALAMVEFDVSPPDYDTLNSTNYQSLRLSKAETIEKFMMSARCVGVQQNGAEITITPHINRKRAGFVPLTEKQKSLSSPGESDLGKAVLAAFAETE